ncbi:MAG: TetR/AcrR family transcriptional regulator [Tabrizicola sp.]|jgi:AcrR family transcriptional regulator|nr:TetR/AcrR family transcriptional regulator [Tabrizicola sp.]
MTRKVQARTLATRDRLLAAGREIVAAGGMAGLRTEEVVLRAGTAKGTFFAHFTDRDQFLAALLAEGLLAEFANMAAPQDRTQLTALLDQVFSAFAADAETVALLARFSGPAGEGLGMDRMICAVIERLAEGVAVLQTRGLVANRADPGVLAEALMALVFHAAASAQCPVHGDARAVRARAEALLQQMTEALLG